MQTGKTPRTLTAGEKIELQRIEKLLQPSIRDATMQKIIEITLEAKSHFADVDNIFVSIDTTLKQTKNNWDEQDRILTALSVVTKEKMESLNNLLADGFQKSLALSRYLSARAKEKAENPQVAKSTEKEFQTGFLKHIAGLVAVDKKIKLIEIEQQDAYSIYGENPLISKMFTSREKDYQEIREFIIEKAKCPNKFASHPEMRNMFLGLSELWLKKLEEDYCLYKKRQPLATQEEGMIQRAKSLYEFFMQDHPVPLSEGRALSSNDCKAKIKLALDSKIVTDIRNSLGDAFFEELAKNFEALDKKANTRSSTAAMNVAMPSAPSSQENIRQVTSPTPIPRTSISPAASSTSKPQETQEPPQHAPRPSSPPRRASSPQRDNDASSNVHAAGSRRR